MRAQLEELVADLDDAPVECDGMTRLVVTRLAEAGIPHQAYLGELTTPAGRIGLHYWVRAAGWVIDLRARRWLGANPGVPHGVVEGCGKPWVYEGRPTEVAPVSLEMFELLRMPIPFVLARP